MKPLRHRHPRQSGFAAVAAIFLVVVMAAMGAFMVSISNAQQLASAVDLQGNRAYWAARAGLEWALGAVTLSASTCPASPPATVDTGATFNLAVTCNLQSYTEGTVTAKIFTLKSVASAGTAGSPTYVERSVSASYEVPVP
jgi:MSHA biogenesis protein MshP